MTWKQVIEIFKFIKAVTPYLADMAERGDYQAKTLHEQAKAILDEHGEEQDQ